MILICFGCKKYHQINVNDEQLVMDIIISNACVKKENFTTYKTLNEFLVGDRNGVCYRENMVIALRLNKTKFDDFSLLIPLTHLITLQITKSNIVNINGIENLKDLKELNLHGNKLFKIDKISNLKKLQYVDLSSNKITGKIDITSLEELRALIVYNNKIDSIVLDNAENLRWIMARNNKISNVDNIKSVINLHILDLYNNPIYDIKDICMLKYLRIVYIGSNNVIEYDKYLEFISKLKKYGKKVITSPDVEIEPSLIDYSVEY